MSPRSPFIVQRILGYAKRSVHHRASGLYLGTVGQHYRGYWSAWLPEELGHDAAVGDAARTMQEACSKLILLRCFRPLVTHRRCSRCRGRDPELEPCNLCESVADATARSRAEHPAWWAHYDAVAALVGDGERSDDGR